MMLQLNSVALYSIVPITIDDGEEDMSGKRIPSTNKFGGGDYTGQIALGAGGATANVILDTA